MSKKQKASKKEKLREQLKLNQKEIANWGALCAEHVLHYFEKEIPGDLRPRKAIEAIRDWIKGKMLFKDVKKAALAAHAAARSTENKAAKAAARAAGHAAASAHMTAHAAICASQAIKASLSMSCLGE